MPSWTDVGLGALSHTTVATTRALQTFSYLERKAADLASRFRGTGQVRYVFVTYTIPLLDGSWYSGRTSGFVRRNETPAEAAERAMRERLQDHHMAARSIGRATVDEYTTGTLTFGSNGGPSPEELARLGVNYLAIRGREQVLIDHFGGARSMVDAAGNRGRSGNAINGIGLDKPYRATAILLAHGRFHRNPKPPNFVPAGSAR